MAPPWGLVPWVLVVLVVVLAASSPVVPDGAAASSPSLSCVCTPSECEEVREWECPGGGVVWDACGCCRVCARVEDEPCGGPEGFHGSCAPGLHCVLDPSQLLLPPRGQRAEARGTCKRAALGEGMNPPASSDDKDPTSSSITDSSSSRWPPKDAPGRRWPSKRNPGRQRTTVSPRQDKPYVRRL